MAVQSVPILMYHSISDAGGPTSLSAASFAAHMQAIDKAGWHVISLETFGRWHRNEFELKTPSLVITFDDGFCDFAENAAPILTEHGFAATIFLPTRKLGKPEAWVGANEPARGLMDWSAVKALSSPLISFCPHSRSHANLTTLSLTELESEVVGSLEDLRGILPDTPAHFAPPYGAVNDDAMGFISTTYDLSVGVNLDVATRAHNSHDLPRIEMFYYADPRRFEAFLNGTGSLYLRARQGLRAVRRMLDRGQPERYQ